MKIMITAMAMTGATMVRPWPWSRLVTCEAPSVAKMATRSQRDQGRPRVVSPYLNADRRTFCFRSLRVPGGETSGEKIHDSDTGQYEAQSTALGILRDIGVGAGGHIDGSM